MSDQQKRRSAKLIRDLCCNYYEGNCILLDDGETTKCPQLLTYSLSCRWFKEAVLPVDVELYSELMADNAIKSCSVCGKPFRSISNRAKYCESCSKTQTKQRKAEWARQSRVHVDV